MCFTHKTLLVCFHAVIITQVAALGDFSFLAIMKAVDRFIINLRFTSGWMKIAVYMSEI